MPMLMFKILPQKIQIKKKLAESIAESIEIV